METRPISQTRRQRNRGNAVIEFAVMAPMIAVVLFGVLETAFYGVIFLSVENAARSAAMRNSFGSDSAADQQSACTIAREELDSILKTNGSLPAPGCSSAPLVVTSKLCGDGVACTGSQMSADGKAATAVTVRLTVPSWVPMRLIPEITRTAEMKVRQTN
ncbi:MAG TPA: TadE/TadG family type IV pilus assembly protein [Bryobacteraceae bacterium]|nr:TadE/TadG family type IV pilus assembly protein [Bryobacteraceae bacterium]